MNDTKCTNDCYDDGEQQVETLCTYCQSYFDSVKAEALRDYKVSPDYWAWVAKNSTDNSSYRNDK